MPVLFSRVDGLNALAGIGGFGPECRRPIIQQIVCLNALAGIGGFGHFSPSTPIPGEFWWVLMPWRAFDDSDFDAEDFDAVNVFDKCLNALAGIGGFGRDLMVVLASIALVMS